MCRVEPLEKFLFIANRGVACDSLPNSRLFDWPAIPGHCADPMSGKNHHDPCCAYAREKEREDIKHINKVRI